MIIIRSRWGGILANRKSVQIIDGALLPGNFLPTETALAETFGVSRTVIREATKTLAAKGLVEVQRGAVYWCANRRVKKHWRKPFPCSYAVVLSPFGIYGRCG